MKNKPIFCLIGKSGSGKSTYLSYLLSDNSIMNTKVRELKYHTTRKKRFPEEDSYYFTPHCEYMKYLVKDEVIEKRKYHKYDEDVVYYTTIDDINVEDCDALICAASVDQAISYYNELENVYMINITLDSDKTRLKRLIDRCKSDDECYEVCRRFLEEDSEYNKINDIDFGDKIININNTSSLYSDTYKNINKIKGFIYSNINK